VSDGPSLAEANPQLYAIGRSTMIPPMAKVALTQSPKRSERPQPQACLRDNSPTLPLRAVHFSDRLAFGPVRSEFFAIAAFSPYAPRSKTASYFYRVQPRRAAALRASGAGIPDGAPWAATHPECDSALGRLSPALSYLTGLPSIAWELDPWRVEYRVDPSSKFQRRARNQHCERDQ
jgi:hypothetical protein